ncbi:retrovirus-related pol polyprotein from transposon TNT 1-94 [Tanacetum coccineum]
MALDTNCFILPNHDTSRILPAELQRNTTNPLVAVTNSLATDYDSVDESSVCSTPLPPLKKLDGAELVSRPNTIKSVFKCDIRKPIWYLDSGCSRYITISRVTCTNMLNIQDLRWCLDMTLHAQLKVMALSNVMKRGTIFNSNKEVVMITPRVRDVYVLDMTSSAQESCFFAKASKNLNWLWHKRLAHLNFKTINSLAKQNLVISLPSLDEAIATACYTQNRSTFVKRHLKTPYEIFRKRISNIDFLHVFGCPVFIHNHKDHLGKFDEKADDGYFLGYSLVSKAFRVFNTRRQKIEETYHITFDESPNAIKFTKPSVDNIVLASKY